MGRHAGNTHMQTVLVYIEDNPRSLSEQVAAGTGLSTKDVSGVLYRLKLQGLVLRADGRLWSAVEAETRQIVTSTWQCKTPGTWVDFALAGMAAPRLNNNTQREA